MFLCNSGLVACGAVLWGAVSLCVKGMLVNTNTLTVAHSRRPESSTEVVLM